MTCHETICLVPNQANIEVSAMSQSLLYHGFVEENLIMLAKWYERWIALKACKLHEAPSIFFRPVVGKYFHYVLDKLGSLIL